MLTQPDDKLREAMRRLRHSEDFKLLEKWLEDQRSDITKRCTLIMEEPRLRMTQGAAQTLGDLLETFEETR